MCQQRMNVTGSSSTGRVILVGKYLHFAKNWIIIILGGKCLPTAKTGLSSMEHVILVG